MASRSPWFDNAMKKKEPDKDCLVIYRFSSVPIGKSDRPSSRHPEEAAFFALVGPGRPKVFVSETCFIIFLLLLELQGEK